MNAWIPGLLMAGGLVLVAGAIMLVAGSVERSVEGSKELGSEVRRVPIEVHVRFSFWGRRE